MSCKRVIIDVDAGIDDIYAILVFLHGEKLEKIKIEAITLTKGNTTLENVCKNVIRLLELMGRTDIPVYKGAKEPLILSEVPLISTYHGKDGFADLIHEKEPDTSIVQTKPASIAIRDIIMDNPGEITLVGLGPLTNIAIAFKLYADLAENVKDIFIMGGNYTGVGNITPMAEFNFYADPEAAYIVLDSANCPITILPFEPCIETSINIEWRFDVLGAVNSPQMELLNKAEGKLRTIRKTLRRHLWTSCDALLAAVMIYPDELVIRKSEHHVTLELHGGFTRGQMVLDHLKQRQPNADIIEKVNANAFMNIMLKVMADA